ncbi:hypothetical protein PILCRDRAFT_13927 [Piloderma croceum F 1598]|uniref:Cell division control protein 14 n=1 Tax=Piloderma croceum (strain F 1598) TaxID=765440 RepID=A0A0C3F517_PILCF|nr:hypothetical protein PILCRDRAFT_13927 [Piloderma croceum F 1598]
MTLDMPSLQSSIQDALDNLVSTRSSTGRKTRALAALEHMLALILSNATLIVPSRLLSWISISTTKLESLASGGSMDHDREAEIAVLLSHLSQSLSIIQGVALNHDPSKHFLGRKYSLEVLLDLLLTCRHLSSPMPLTTTTINTPSSTRSNTPTDATLIPLSSTVLDTLLCILVDSSSALRVFEECNGVQAVVKLLKTAGAPREVRMKCLEFLYFYLMDESPSTSSNANVPSPPSQPTTHKPSLSTKLRVPSSPTKRAATPSSPTKTAPSTPIGPRLTHTPLRSQSNSKPFTPGPRRLRPSSSSSSALSNTWGSISSFSSGRSSSTTTTTPEPDDPHTTEVFPPVPLTPSKLTITLPDHNMATNVGNGKLSLCPPIILRKDVDIDYVPISPKKTKFARIDSLGTSGMVPKVRELKDLSTGSRSMPTLSNASVATSMKNPFGTAQGYGHDTESDEYGKQDGHGYNGSSVRTAEEKKEILGGMLGNVEALVDGVRKAGIWGLG